MDHQLTFTEKKPKSSFWIRLLRLPRKSNSKDKSDESLKRHSKLYSSFRCTKDITPDDNAASDETENFTTVECNSLMELHKDAGILFLNQNTASKSAIRKEENKHVQFAPTPMNKCYRVDVKAAPAKRESSDEDKENSQLKSMKPARSILRLEKQRKAWFHRGTFQDSQSNLETKIVNVTYTEGPKLKTPSIPRTSTKIALVDRKNSSLPQLNVSNIVKYGSLPRTTKFIEENRSVTNNLPSPSESSAFDNRESCFSVQSQKNPTTFKTVAEIEWHRRSLRSVNKQSCFGVSNSSRMLEQKIHHSSNHEVVHRQSLGGIPIQLPRRNISYQKIPFNTELNYPMCMNSENFSRADCIKSQSNSLPRKTQFLVPKLPSKCAEKIRSTRDLQNQTTSLVHVPDKSINEVGLPIVTIAKGRSAQHRDKSPHYIALAGTVSGEKYSSYKKSAIANCSRYPFDDVMNKHAADSNRGYIRKENSCTSKESILQSKIRKANEFPNILDDKRNATAKANKTFAERSYSPFISETRRQALKLAMYVQKRKVVNKICKYNSKQIEEGFSSMADDECSFNCSCSACVARHSRINKRNILKSFWPSNKDKDNKYFFIAKPNTQNEDMPLVVPMQEHQPHDPIQITSQCNPPKDTKVNSNGTWYECNDSLCKTPVRTESNAQDESNIESQTGDVFRTPVKNTPSDVDPTNLPVNDVVENLYENITLIINSATKKQFKTQDVKRILSTPKSSPFNLAISGSCARIRKSLSIANPETFNEVVSGNSPLKSPFFNDSIVLLQEIFQKLSQECKELLQPNLTSSSGHFSSDATSNEPKTSNRYVNDLVKNLQSKELSEEDFASIIGGIAQNIFIETKARRIGSLLIHSRSLPDLQKKDLEEKEQIQPALSLRHIYDQSNHCMKNINVIREDAMQLMQLSNQTRIQTSSPRSLIELGSRHLPEGWSKSPTECSSNTSTKLSSSGTEKEDSKCSETELQLLENAIRLGMGLSPVSKLKKASCVASPKKTTKYKSKEVLSGKGKLKLKIYNNSGLVTVHVMRASKLDWASGKELNCYVKVTMNPDDSKKVHWRTTVRKGQKNPVFNQKFSFEILTEDATKRLIFSLWHRDYAKERSELIGCMSFSVRHVLDNSHNVDGWYRLLREGFGTQKHFAAHARKSSCSLKHEN